MPRSNAGCGLAIPAVHARQRSALHADVTENSARVVGARMRAAHLPFTG